MSLPVVKNSEPVTKPSEDSKDFPDVHFRKIDITIGDNDEVHIRARYVPYDASTGEMYEEAEGTVQYNQVQKVDNQTVQDGINGVAAALEYLINNQ